MIPSSALVLALNSGSSSLKASVLRGEGLVVSFLAERLNTPESVLHISSKTERLQESVPRLSHKDALERTLQYLKDHNLFEDLVAVGHRVVHGGTTFSDSVLVGDDSVLEQIKDISHLAPLHNPHNLAGIETMRTLLPSIPNVAVFDTAFHSTIPVEAYTYPIPKEYRDKDMRKFGFHGTSVRYVSEKAAKIVQEKTGSSFGQAPNLIICHLGNGASVTAVSNNMSKDTSMGFTPLSGLMMGTRCGSVDPSLLAFATQVLGKTVDEVTEDFNNRSGLLGIAGNHDMRALLESKKDKDSAKLAVDMFVYRLAQHVASSLVALDGPLDALVFTAGIGEHSAEIRQQTVKRLSSVLTSVTLDEDRNISNGKHSRGILSKEGEWPLVLVVPTNEEVMIANESLRFVTV